MYRLDDCSHAAPKVQHRHSTGQSQMTLEQRRLSIYRNQPLSHEGSVYGFSYQGANSVAAMVQHQVRVAGDVERAMGQFGACSP